MKGEKGEPAGGYYGGGYGGQGGQPGPPGLPVRITTEQQQPFYFTAFSTFYQCLASKDMWNSIKLESFNEQDKYLSISRGQRESPSSVLQGPRALQVTQEEGTKAGKGTQAHRGPPDLQDHPPHLEPTGQHRVRRTLSHTHSYIHTVHRQKHNFLGT